MTKSPEENRKHDTTGLTGALKTMTREEMERRVAELRSAGPPTLDVEDAGLGWTIRDEYAARAMQALLALDAPPTPGGSAVQAFAIADEMMSAREHAKRDAAKCVCKGAAGQPHESGCPYSPDSVASAMRAACVTAALRVFDQPGGGFTRDELRDAIANAEASP